MSRFLLTDLPAHLRQQAQEKLEKLSKSVTTVKHDGKGNIKKTDRDMQEASKEASARLAAAHAERKRWESQVKSLQDTTPDEVGRAEIGQRNDAVRLIQKYGQRNKYGAIATWVDGIRFPSKKEAERYVMLKRWESEGRIKNLERQVAYDIEVNGIKVCRYIADFRYDKRIKNRNKPDHWEQVVEDVKGMKKGVPYQMFLLKKDLMRAVFGVNIAEI